MRLIVECEHGWHRPHVITRMGKHCEDQQSITDPDAILDALAEAGVLDIDEVVYGVLTVQNVPYNGHRYVSSWRETK